MRHVLFVCHRNANRYSDRQIRGCADQVPARYGEAVRGHVMTLARRTVKQCVEADRCAA